MRASAWQFGWFLLGVFLLPQMVLSNDELKPRIREYQQELQNAVDTAALEVPQLIEKAKSVFYTEKQNDTAKRRLENDAEQCLESLVKCDQAIPLRYQNFRAENHQFETYSRLPESPQEMPAARAFFSGPGNCAALHSGEVILSRTDISAPSRGGVGFQFTRTFRSHVTYAGPMGNGWDHNHNIRLISENADPENTNELQLYDGSRIVTFTRTEDGWQTEKGYFLKLAPTEDGNSWQILNDQFTQFLFEKAQKPGCWRIARIVSRVGNGQNMLTYQYDKTSGLLDRVIDPYGNTFQFSYTRTGRIEWVQGAGQIIFFEYDETGNLVRTRIPSVVLSANETVDAITRYEFESGHLTAIWPKNSKTSTRFQYEANRLVQAVIRSGEESQALQWSFQYEDGRTIVQPPAPFPKEIFTFSGVSPSHASLPSTREIPAHNACWNYRFNSDCLLTETCFPEGQKEITEYDSSNANVLLRRNVLRESLLGNGTGKGRLKEKGKRTVYLENTPFPVEIISYEVTQDGQETILGKESFRYTLPEYLLAESVSFTVPVRFFYNRYGEIAIKQFADNSCTVYGYAEHFPKAGEPIKFQKGSVQGAGLCIEIVEDADPQMIRNAAHELGISLMCNEKTLNSQTVLAHNLRGEIIKSQMGNDRSFIFKNLFGDTILEYSSENGLTLNQFNSNFEKIHIFHPLGTENSYSGETIRGFSCRFSKETFTFDAFGQISMWSPTEEKVSILGIKPVWKYERTPSGLLLAITNPNGVRLVTVYDETGRKSQEFVENGNERAVLSSEHRYSPEGRILAWKDNHQAEWREEYNELGENWKSVSPDGTFTVLEQNGMEQIVLESRFSGEKLLSQNQTFYGENTQPIRTETLRIYGDETATLITSEILYDVRGQVSAVREVREDSWTVFLHDALGRRLASRSPTGDISLTCYWEDMPVFSKQIQKNEADGTLHAFGSLQLFNLWNEPWLSVPVDETGSLAVERVTIRHTDLIGNEILSRNPGLQTVHTTFNSLHWQICQRVIPLSHTFGEEETTTDFTYDPAGNLLSRSVQNRALAFVGTKDSAQAELREVPQTVRSIFDPLGRLTEEIQPDGVRICRTYDPSSLLYEMKWFSKSGKLLRHLEFTYDQAQRLSKIHDKQKKQIVRELEYDPAGRVCKLTDCSGTKTVRLEREFDSLNTLRTEKIFLDNKLLPVKEIDTAPTFGNQTLTWKNFPHGSPYWSATTFHTDPSGRVIGMDVDFRPFCQWKHQGPVFVQRDIPESGLIQNRKLNCWGELESLEIGKREETKTPWFLLQYTYGKFGEVEAVTSQMRDSHGKTRESAQYFQYDSRMNLTGQNHEEFIAESPEKRRNQLFFTGTPISSEQTAQMRYDQAGNVWTRFTGETAKMPIPGKISIQNSPFYYSAAGVLPQGTENLTETQLCELASNRCTAIATPQTANPSALKATEYRYNELGCLTEYDGKYISQDKVTSVRWHLEYDVFSRLSSMTAYEQKSVETPNKQEGAEPEIEKKPAAVLHFTYDALNRRLLKEVHDEERGTSDSWATLYERNHPCLVMKQDEDRWSVSEQYLWGIDSQELLMCIVSGNRVENTTSPLPVRYFIHQDRNYSVIASTKYSGRELLLTGTASYFAFGENASKTVIQKVSSSQNLESPEACCDRHLDDGGNTIFTANEHEAFIELELESPAKLEYLRIFSERQFPAEGAVWLIPGEEPSPTPQNIQKWKAEHLDWCLGTWKLSDVPDLRTPIDIPLSGRRSGRIVLTWDKDLLSIVSIREFQVGIQPENPASIAYAGQWLDTETGLYYQLNRYRLPELNGKFISPDPLGFTDGMNFYAYAHNNPLSWHDPNGEFAHILIGAAIGGLLNGGFAIIDAWLNGKDFTDGNTWAHIGVSILSGAVTGGTAAATLGAGCSLWAVGMATGAAGNFTGGVGHALVDGSSIGNSLAIGAQAGLEGAVLGGIGGAVGGAVNSILPTTMPTVIRYATNGILSGTLTGGISGSYYGWRETGTIDGILTEAKQGALNGAVIGGSAAIGMYVVSQYLHTFANNGNAKVTDPNRYARPGNFRKGVRETVWENAKDSRGHVRDPGTGRYISKDKPWDMGHKPGYEFRKHTESAKIRGISRESFLDEYNDPRHYRPELPSSNRSHRFEAPNYMNYWL